MGGSLAQLIASRGTMRVLRSLTTHDRPLAPSVSAVEQANSRDATIPHVITEESAYLTLPYVFACAFVSRNNKATLLAWVELEKAEVGHLPILRSASAVVCGYRTIISYHRVCYGGLLWRIKLKCRIARVVRNILAKYLVGWKSIGALATK